ncbi:SigB/SigF/SigG family RNA polymerase sigma factor [Streptomyces chromofuscus]|uniref:SigB/SigF/SigG family RNA polymerase sigma factor n=1 Tax=Streptomyces chromofuscus TaxID=42881 RepID=A0A7M2T8R0_STRCW|nr:SigB/SigF/SigG family RNA polymerase sigma factor [Streptomyces chromofuscus]QOV44305.1 SigB/SigF/SigG family RNA polymerase sigma factor [Streptomyces chromofuscus]GGT23685.1 RNA polymerase sigma factor [Streptomyces chromofuscus]
MTTAVTTAPAETVARPARDAPDTAVAFRRLAVLPDGLEKERVQEEVLRAWLPMAHRIAWRYRDRGESTDDLRQVAALGLLKAIRRFDPARGPFEPFAIPTIRGELRRHFRDRMWDVRVPRRVQELRNTVRAAYVDLANVPGSPRPTVTQLAHRTGLDEEQVREGMAALESYSALSLDAANGDTGGDADADGPSLADLMGEPDDGFQLVVDRESVKDAVRRLPQRERAILYLRFFEDWTQRRIAERMGISQMHVSRLLTQTCARIRDETLQMAEAGGRC